MSTFIPAQWHFPAAFARRLLLSPPAGAADEAAVPDTSPATRIFAAEQAGAD